MNDLDQVTEEILRTAREQGANVKTLEELERLLSFGDGVDQRLLLLVRSLMRRRGQVRAD